MRILMCAFVALLWTGVAHAGDFSFMTGNQLLAFCKDPVNRVTCVAYVEAVSDALGAAALAGMLKKDIICIPAGVTSGQAADVVMTFLTNDPEHRADTAAWLALVALAKAWPCPRQK
jgi:hypothetical protein